MSAWRELQVDGDVIASDEEFGVVRVGFPAAENGEQEEGEYQESLGWANSACINCNEVEDSITVSISAKDPRGAFVMSLCRLKNGTLLLHVPHPKDTSLNLLLTELHQGIYRVG